MSKLPIRATLTIWLVLLLTAWNALRVWTALSWQAVLIEYHAQPAPWVTAVTGGLWTALGLLIIWSIWQSKTWAGKILFGAAIGYTVWYWSERLIWQEAHPNWVFAVILNLTLVVFIIFTTKLLTREAHEQNSQHPEIE